MGAHPFGDSWPFSLDGTTETSVFLRDASLSISGNTPSRSSHIMNTQTGEFVAGDRMVAVVAEDPVDAEAMTTAWIACGSDSAPDWMSKFNLQYTYRIK
jgi:thiamine biosynthesis lipoprotein